MSKLNHIEDAEHRIIHYGGIVHNAVNSMMKITSEFSDDDLNVLLARLSTTEKGKACIKIMKNILK